MELTRSPRPRCYLASPLGFTEAGRDYYGRVYLPALAAVIEPVDPWALTSPHEIEDAAAAGRRREFALEIGRRNLDAIRSCTLLVAFLDGQEPDSGTVAELGFGVALGLRCFGLRTDLRQSGEDGVTVNLQIETLVHSSGGRMAGSLDELVTCLRQATGVAAD